MAVADVWVEAANVRLAATQDKVPAIHLARQNLDGRYAAAAVSFPHIAQAGRDLLN